MGARDLPESIDRAREIVLSARGEDELLVALNLYRGVVELDTLRRLNDGVRDRAVEWATAPPPESAKELISSLIGMFFDEIERRIDAVPAP